MNNNYVDFEDLGSKLLHSNEVKSVFPLSFWSKNIHFSEYYPLDYTIQVRGTAFLYKTMDFYYLITARHNFSEEKTELTDEYIMSRLNNLVLIKNFHELETDITRDKITETNQIKFKYIAINANYEHDICILRLIDNIPEDRFFLESPELDFSTFDDGFLVGYPKNLIDCEPFEGRLEVQKQSILVRDFGFIIDKDGDAEIVYSIDKKFNGILSGYSGSPILHYNSNSKKFNLFGMNITQGDGKIRCVPIIKIAAIIERFEENLRKNL